MISRLLFRLALFLSDKSKRKIVGLLIVVILIAPFAGIIGTRIYQSWDSDPARGGASIAEGAFGETYAVPEYLDQGWGPANSLWFYTTTQGSALLPYDFLLALEQPGLNDKIECERNGKKGPWFLCNGNVDRFRYLPQTRTLFNPDALPVGFAKETYEGKDYAGYTCAACHTGQVNFQGRALRIDGGPAMADMVGFLTELARAMKLTQGVPNRKNPRLERFVENVLALGNDYRNRAEIEVDIAKWTNVVALYNNINHPTYRAMDPATGKSVRRDIDYGYARLDAFGRIYNRVIEHAINKDQVVAQLSEVIGEDGRPLLTREQIDVVVADTNTLILRDRDFARIVERLTNLYTGADNAARRQDLLLRVRDKIFNSPNAPVSYPFLWDVPSSDYVQWNGLASDAGAGPLGRNAGEVIGVFGILDWQEDKRWFTKLTGVSLSGFLSSQNNKKQKINFKSSIDLFNLQRLESQLSSLVSPRWPFCRDAKDDTYYLPAGPQDVPVDTRGCRPGDHRFDDAARGRGRLIYIKKCESCHAVIKRDAWDRLNVSHMMSLDEIGTDPTMARNSVAYRGKSGNLSDTYQSTDAGELIIKEEAPVVQILTAVTAGVVGTSDPDKWWARRIVDYVYALVVTFFDNRIKPSAKAGSYNPDTTAEPYASLLSYRARSLNGIWATAPYLHNGSVPSLYDLLLPARDGGDVDGDRCTAYRPDRFVVGAREFDPVKVGLKSEGYDGFVFDTSIPGNYNTGHEYGGCDMSHEERMDLIEYLKSL